MKVSRPTHERIAFIGLGAMGAPMARRLATAFRIQGYDRAARARRALARTRGIAVHASAVDAARDADAIITMLPDGRAVGAVLLGRGGVLATLRPGALVIDMSSSDPADTARLAAACRARRIAFLDAPVSGRVEGARAGTLTIMAGGNASTLARAQPILARLGSRVLHAGPAGAGHIAKALNNYIAAAGTVAAYEAFLAGRALGLDPRALAAIWNASTGRNSTTANKLVQHVLRRRYASGFALGLMAKDVAIAARLARQAGTATPLFGVNTRLWRAAAHALGHDADHTRLYEYLESGHIRR